MTAGSAQADAQAAKAAGAEAFMAMMRRVHEASGLTAGQVAAYSGLPRSTTYRFLDSKNTTLPKNRDQVEAFLDACRVPRRSIDRMLEMWDEISGNTRPSRGRVVLELPGEDDDPPPRRADTEVSWAEWDEDRSSRRDIPRSHLPATGQTVGAEQSLADSAATPTPEAAGAHHDPCICLELHHRRRASHRTEQVPVAQYGRFEQILPLLMLVMALYPLGAVVWLGGRLPGELTTIVSAGGVLALLLICTATRHSRRCIAEMTPTRLAISTFAAACSGLLAWAAALALPTAVFTGFVVFTMAPRWFSFTRWTDIASTAGVFTLITAVLCGATLGTAAACTEFPIAGSILVGALGAATAVAILHSTTVRQTPTAWTKLATLSPERRAGHGLQ